MTKCGLSVSRGSKLWHTTGRIIGKWTEIEVKSNIGVNMRYVETDALNDTKAYPYRLHVKSVDYLRKQGIVDV